MVARRAEGVKTHFLILLPVPDTMLWYSGQGGNNPSVHQVRWSFAHEALCQKAIKPYPCTHLLFHHVDKGVYCVQNFRTVERPSPTARQIRPVPKLSQ